MALRNRLDASTTGSLLGDLGDLGGVPARELAIVGERGAIN